MIFSWTNCVSFETSSSVLRINPSLACQERGLHSQTTPVYSKTQVKSFTIATFYITNQFSPKNGTNLYFWVVLVQKSIENKVTGNSPNVALVYCWISSWGSIIVNDTPDVKSNPSHLNHLYTWTDFTDTLDKLLSIQVFNSTDLKSQI